MFQLILDVLNGSIAKDAKAGNLDDEFVAWALGRLFWPCFFLAIGGTGLALWLTK